MNFHKLATFGRKLMCGINSFYCVASDHGMVVRMGLKGTYNEGLWVVSYEPE
jgi:hypothetical protein